MRKSKIIAATTALSLIAAAAFAHGGATGIVKERMDGMMAMGKALTAVGDMFKGKTEFNPTKVEASSVVIKQHAVEIGRLFPDTEASRKGKGTEALPAIWEKPDSFLALAKELEKRSDELADLAKTGDKRKIRVGFAKLSKTCASCHTDYRKPKENE